MGQREAGENRRAFGSCTGPELTLTPGLAPAFFLRAKWDKPVAQVTHSETVLLLVQREGKEPGQDAVGRGGLAPGKAGEAAGWGGGGREAWGARRAPRGPQRRSCLPAPGSAQESHFTGSERGARSR